MTTHTVSVLAELAKTLSDATGYFVIVSHLNAHVESGLQWLDDVVVPGLRKGGDFQWNLEVHGNTADIPSESENDDSSTPENPGPAVYIINKGGLIKESTKSKNGVAPTMPLKFFSY